MAAKTPEYSITKFRKQLPDAFKRVVHPRGDVVRVTRRGTSESALLINESHYLRMEGRIRELQRQLREALRGRQAGAMFKLIGTAELTVPEEAVLETTRRQQASHAAVKARELST